MSAERTPHPSSMLHIEATLSHKGRGSAVQALRRHRHRREVDEPALRLHKALHLRAHRARRDVVGDVEKRRIVDRGRMQFSERRVARGGVEGLARLGDRKSTRLNSSHITYSYDVF